MLGGAPGKASRQRLIVPLALLLAVVVAGASGYRLIEGWDWLDSVYMTVITLATVGYMEIHPLSTTGRLFTIGLIAVGLATVTFLAAVAGRYLFEDWLADFVWRTRVKKQIERLSGHYILCGCGRVGRLVCRELIEERVPFVVIERDPAIVTALVEEGLLVLQADATSEETLEQAGVREARGLFATLPDDAGNLFVTITARDLNPALPIVARSTDESVEKRLIKAGASRVISPNRIGGRMIAQALLAPDVLDFLSIAVARDNLSLEIEQVKVGAHSPLAASRPAVGEMREKYGVSVVALRKESGPLFDMPPHDRQIEPGDLLIVVGRTKDCEELSRLAS